jgi:GTP-binding protein EngB required for normal cell division
MVVSSHESKSGSQLVQMAVEKASLEQLRKLWNHLRGFVSLLATSKHGNHVIQKLVPIMEEEMVDEMVDEIAHEFMRVVTDRFGCRVVQRIVERHQKSRIVPVMICQHAHRLCWDEYGHFPVESLLIHGEYSERIFIVQTLQCGGFHGKGEYVKKRAIELGLLSHEVESTKNENDQKDSASSEEEHRPELVRPHLSTAQTVRQAAVRFQAHLKRRNGLNVVFVGLPGVGKSTLVDSILRPSARSELARAVVQPPPGHFKMAVGTELKDVCPGVCYRDGGSVAPGITFFDTPGIGYNKEDHVHFAQILAQTVHSVDLFVIVIKHKETRHQALSELASVIKHIGTKPLCIVTTGVDEMLEESVCQHAHPQCTESLRSLLDRVKKSSREELLRIFSMYDERPQHHDAEAMLPLSRFFLIGRQSMYRSGPCKARELLDQQLDQLRDLLMNESKSCTLRVPEKCDTVQSSDADCIRTATAADGTKKAWKLEPGQDAVVMDVDDDGDFKLMNPAGVVSDWVYRSPYKYVGKVKAPPGLCAPEPPAKEMNGNKIVSRPFFRVLSVSTEEGDLGSDSSSTAVGRCSASAEEQEE